MSKQKSSSSCLFCYIDFISILFSAVVLSCVTKYCTQIYVTCKRSNVML
uniref:Uncharacterized protein n=1 Tax=Arundo donax TaxID=35708 RepID=A0A0A9J4F0_ARUDO